MNRSVDVVRLVITALMLLGVTVGLSRATQASFASVRSVSLVESPDQTGVARTKPLTADAGARLSSFDGAGLDAPEQGRMQDCGGVASGEIGDQKEPLDCAANAEEQPTDPMPEPTQTPIASGTDPSTETPVPTPAGETPTTEPTLEPTSSVGTPDATETLSLTPTQTETGEPTATATSTATPTEQPFSVFAEEGLTIEKFATYDEIYPGDGAEFEFYVSNSSDQLWFYDVTLTDQLPAGIEWELTYNWNSDLYCGIDDGELSCEYGGQEVGLGPGEYFYIGVVSAEVSTDDCGRTFVNDAASISGFLYESYEVVTATSNSASIFVQCDVLDISKEALEPEIYPGEQAGYRITISNPTEYLYFREAGFTDSLPAAASGLDWEISEISSPYFGCEIQPQNLLSCALLTDQFEIGFGAGDSYSVEVVTSPETPVTTADCAEGLSNQAIAYAEKYDWPDFTASSENVRIAVLCSTFTAVKSGNGPVNAEDNAIFSITITNTNASIAQKVVLDDDLPAADIAWFESGDPHQSCNVSKNGDGTSHIHCSFGDVPGVGGANVRTYQVTGKTSKTNCGPLTNTGATIGAANLVPGSNTIAADSTIEVRCPDVTIEKSATSPVTAGEDVEFTLTVSNPAGPSNGAAYNVKLTDVLPQFGTGGWEWTDNRCSINTSLPLIAAFVQTFVCDLGTMPPDAEPIVITLTHATSPADCGVAIENSAVVSSSNEPSSNGTNNSSGVQSVTVECPDLHLTHEPDFADEDGGSVISAGETATFTISAKNAGPGVATNMVIDDTLPAGVWSVVTTPAGLCPVSSSGTLHCELGNVGTAEILVQLSRQTSVADCGLLESSASAGAANHTAVTDTALIAVLCPDLSISKEAVTGVISAGERAVFKISVANAAGDDVGAAFDVSLDDSLPVGVEWSIDSVSPALDENQNCELEPATDESDYALTCDFGEMGSGSSYVVAFSGLTDRADCGEGSQGTLNNQAWLFSTFTEPVQSENASITVQCPAIAVDKTADDDSISSTDTAAYTTTVSNAGPGTAFDVVVTDTLPAGTWNVSAPEEWDCRAGDPLAAVAGALFTATTRFECVIDELAPTGDQPHLFTASRVTAEAECGTLGNAVTVNATNDVLVSDSATVSVLCPSLTVDKSPDDAAVNAGETASFTVTVTNGGPGVAKAVALSDALPGGEWQIMSTVVNACPATATATLACDLGDLDAGKSATVIVSRTTLLDDCANEANTFDLINRATVDAGNDDLDEDDGRITVNCPDLVVAVVIEPDTGTVGAGDPIQFSVTVSNQGQGAATGVTLNNGLTGGQLVFPSASGVRLAAVPVCDEAPENELVCDLGTLEAGESQSIAFTAQTSADSCGSLTNLLSVTAENETDTADATVTSETEMTVVCPASLTVSKTASVFDASPGDTISYFYLITNVGEDRAENIVAIDDFGTAGDASDDVTLACEDDALEGGRSTQCSLTVIAAADQVGQLVNEVRVNAVSSLTGDAIPTARDTASVTVLDEVAPCSFPVVFVFVSDITFSGARGQGELTINAGSQLTFPNGAEQGAGCQSNDWEFIGSINGEPAHFKFKGVLRPESIAGAGSLRAFPAMAAASDLILEVTEIDLWAVGAPQPIVPASVRVLSSPMGAEIVIPGGGRADVAITPTLEIPFETITRYEIGKAALPVVGAGLVSVSASGGMLFGLATAAPILTATGLMLLRRRRYAR